MIGGGVALLVTTDSVGLGRADDFGVTLTCVSHEFARAVAPGRDRGRRVGRPPAGAELMTAKYFRP